MKIINAPLPSSRIFTFIFKRIIVLIFNFHICTEVCFKSKLGNFSSRLLKLKLWQIPRRRAGLRRSSIQMQLSRTAGSLWISTSLTPSLGSVSVSPRRGSSSPYRPPNTRRAQAGIMHTSLGEFDFPLCCNFFNSNTSYGILMKVFVNNHSSIS